MSKNLQLTPDEIKDAYVAALARKAKAQQSRSPAVKKSCGSIGYSEYVGEDGEIVKSWVFDSHYGGRFTRVGGWASEEDAERGLLAHVRSIQAAPNWTRSIASPPPVRRKRITPTFNHIKYGYCPTCGNETVSSMFGMYEECSIDECSWWNSPPVGCSTHIFGERAHVYCDEHDYRTRMCCAAWASGLWSACIGEPASEPDTSARSLINRAWRGGFDRGASLLHRDVQAQTDQLEPCRDTMSDVRRLNAHLLRLRSAGEHLEGT